MGGTVKAVASDVAEIIRAGTEIGLSLNVSKCEFITHRNFHVDDAMLQSLNRVELTGTPLFYGGALDAVWDDRYATLPERWTC